MTQVMRAAGILEAMGISTDIWSVTSYTELARDSLATERRNRLQRNDKQTCYVEELLTGGK